MNKWSQRSLDSGVWKAESGVRSLEPGVWSLKLGARSLASPEDPSERSPGLEFLSALALVPLFPGSLVFWIPTSLSQKVVNVTLVYFED